MRKVFLLVVVAVVAFGLLSGCGMKYTQGEKYKYAYHPTALVDADEDLMAAQARGADKQCPAKYNAVAKLIDDAYATYYACKTQDAIDMAMKASGMARALCGECAPAPAPAPVVKKTMILKLNFDFDKAIIKDQDIPQLKKAIEFIKSHKGSKVRVAGHTDGKGSEKYNQKLSERRAAAVVNYFVKKGAIKRADISFVGYGKSRPIATNKTEEGRAENRRVEVHILSK
jgi:outer membrane protein OmpA-like peptidoglycan-associated protein